MYLEPKPLTQLQRLPESDPTPVQPMLALMEPSELQSLMPADFPSSIVRWEPGQLPSRRQEKTLTEIALTEVRRVNPDAKPFLRYAGADPTVPFYVDADWCGREGWQCDPAANHIHDIPPYGIAILYALWRAGYPIEDVRFAKLVRNLETPHSSFSDVVRRERGKIARKMKAAARGAKIAATEIVDGMLDGLKTPLADPVLAIRIGREHYIEVLRWD